MNTRSLTLIVLVSVMLASALYGLLWARDLLRMAGGLRRAREAGL